MPKEDSNRVLHDAFALLTGSGGSSTSRQARGERKGTCEANGGALDDLKRTIDLCAEVHKRKRSQPSSEPDLSDAGLSKLARFSDALDLHRYRKFVHLIPRIVNVVRKKHPHCRSAHVASRPCLPQVSLGEAVPEPDTGTVLPLNLREVASRLTNAVRSSPAPLVPATLTACLFCAVLRTSSIRSGESRNRTLGAAERKPLRLRYRSR